MNYVEYVHHFLRLLDGEDGSPVTPPGTPPAREPLPHETSERDVAVEAMREDEEDERCGRLIR